MFKIPIPSENIILEIEDLLYLSLYRQLRDNRDVLKYLKEYKPQGYSIKPLN